MKLLISFCSFFICSFIVFASGVSEKRFPNETFEQALERNQPNKSLIKMKHGSALSKKVPIKDLDFSKVPEVLTMDALMNLFQIIRDTRFLKANNDRSFLRRITWLYPDDGCYARAAVSSIKIKEAHLKRPFKIFAFGSLEVSSPYALEGSVSWWYHVALVVKYMGTYYVLDPALNNKRPMLFDEWYSVMGHISNIKGAICNSYTYDPFDSCLDAKENSEYPAMTDQQSYLLYEWDRVSALGFDPLKILGANPPWL